MDAIKLKEKLETLMEKLTEEDKGTIQETITLLDLFEPKKPQNLLSFGYIPALNITDMSIGNCPVCGATCISDMTHCEKCAQLLDWSKT